MSFERAKSILSIILLLFCLFATGSLRAQIEPAVVVIIVPEPSPSVFSRRLAAEIRSIGYAVQLLISASEDMSPDSAATIIREHRAVAVVECPSTRNDVPVVWIGNRNGENPKRHLIASELTDQTTELAIRTAENLYAALMKIESEGQGEIPAAPATAPATAAAAETESPSSILHNKFRFSISVGGLFSPGLLTPSVGGLTGISFIPRHRTGIAWLLVFPITPERFADDSGSISLWSLMSGLGLTVSILPQVSSWRAMVGFGAGAQLSWGKGIAAEETTGFSETERSVTFWMHLSLSRHLTRSLSIRADTFSSFALPPLKIETPLHSTPYAFPLLGIMAGIEFGG